MVTGAADTNDADRLIGTYPRLASNNRHRTRHTWWYLPHHQCILAEGIMKVQSSWWSSIIAALSSTIVSHILAALAQITIIRMLNSSGYGTYTTLYAWLAIAGSIIGAGFDLWLLDYASRHPTRIRAHLRQILRLKLILWVITTFVCLWFIQQVDLVLLCIGLCVILLDSMSTSLTQSLRALNRHHTVALIQLIAPSLLLAIVIAWQPRTIMWLLLIQLFIAGIVLITTYYIGMRHIPLQSDAPSALMRSSPFVVSDIFAQLYTYTSTVLLAQYATPHDVGIFRGAWSFIAYTVVVPSMLLSTTLPLLNHATATQRRSILWRSAIAFGMYVVSVSGFILFGGGEAITVFYGESFAPSIAFITHLAILPLIKAGIFFGVMLLIHRQRVIWRIGVQLVTVAVLWSIMPPLIATSGISGAIQAQLITESVLAIGYLIGGIWVRRHSSAPAPIWPPRRIVVTNMYGTHNLGDAAIHRAQHEWLTQQFPDATIHHCYAVAPHPHTHPGISHWVYDYHGHIAPWWTRLRRMMALCWCIIMHSIGVSSQWGMTRHERQTLTTIITADLVCASGGGYLYDHPSNHPWWRLLTWDWWLCADMLVAILWKRPLVLLPQSIGPLHNRPFHTFIRWITTKAHMVYVRESQSAHTMATLGVTHHTAPDFVWGLPAPHPMAPPSVPTLGITVMDWAGQGGAKTVQDAYEDTLITVATTLHHRGWHIQLFGQATDNTPGWDDTVIVQRIAAHLPFARIMPPASHPVALQQQYMQLTCLISTRLHGALLRFAMEQSAIVIAYHPKAHGMMHDMGLAAWCLPIDTLTPEALFTAIDTHRAQLPRVAQHAAMHRVHLATLTIPPPTPSE